MTIQIRPDQAKSGQIAHKELQANRSGWQVRWARYSRIVLRWGWFVALTILLTTIATNFIADLPSTTVYQATLQVQVQVPSNLGQIGANLSTTLYSKLFLNPDTLSKALPTLNKQPQFKDLPLSGLQGLVSATADTGTRILELSAIGATPQDASFVVTTVYQTFVENFHTNYANLLNGMQSSLTTELKQVETDVTNSGNALGQLNAAGQGNTFEARQLSNLHKEQQQLVSAINAQLLALGQQNNNGATEILQLVNSKARITTIDGAASTKGLRLALSPLIGLVMGLGGVLLASRFSNRVPLRGKKREMILPHVTSIMPVLPGVNNNRLRLQVLKETASESLPLLRRLRYQAAEHEKRLRVITVTSPRGREGKSIIAASLALAAAQNGLRTLLVDANPGRPVLHTWFQLPNANGTLDAIDSLATGTVSSSPIVATSTTGLSFIPIGKSTRARRPGSTDGLLPADGLRPLTELLSKQADLVIFDGPSLLSDISTVNPVSLSDIVLLVLDAQRSQSSKVLDAEDLLTKMGVSYATVLNRARRELVE